MNMVIGDMLDQIILSSIFSITVFPMAVGFNKVRLLLAICIFLNKTLLQLYPRFIIIINGAGDNIG